MENLSSRSIDEQKLTSKVIPNYVGAVVVLSDWQGVTEGGGEWIVLRQSTFKIFAISAKGGHHSIDEQEFELIADGWTVRAAAFKPATLYCIAKSLVEFIRHKENSKVYFVDQAYDDAMARIMDLFGLLLDQN